MTMPKPLPIGIQTFQKVIEGGYLYIDKTQQIYELIRTASGVYFLARPRRFGKSLLLSTLEEIFLGNKALFEGLWLYDSPYTWEKHPVIRIDFSLFQVKSAEELKHSMKTHLNWIADQHQVSLNDGEYHEQFVELLRLLTVEKQGVVLIDEYDKPLIDNLDNLAEAQRIRDVLKGFYTVLKSMDAYLRFVFLTGVSKFSRVGVFSGLNNLEDLTMQPKFATALGITQTELTANLGGYIEAFAEQANLSPEALVQQIQHWYDGFCFAAGCENVYNPFSTLLVLKHQRFANYWFESGTPTFLVKLLKERDYPVEQLQQLKLEEISFSTYELENLAIIPLLYQTGYLTIKAYDPVRRLYTLSYPNFEVENAFVTWLLDAFSESTNGLTTGHLWQLIDALQANDLDEFFDVLQVFFAQVPYNLHLKQEKYYQTIFYLIFTLIGLRISAEVTTNRGRIDAVMELAEAIYLFEFKLNSSAQAALAQVKRSKYYERYRRQGKPLHLVGVNFDSQQREVSEWQEETVNSQ
ncbi:MAG: AAA family ATPase [Caldilineaceae bacterium]